MRSSKSGSRALVAAVLALVVGCDDGPVPAWARTVSGAADGAVAEGPAAPVAKVNGGVITTADLAQALAAAARADNPHGGGGATVAPDRDRVLATLVIQELAAQRAQQLGLDADPGYREELSRLETQLAGFRRQRLALLLERDVAAKVEVSEATARAYYDQRLEPIRTETRVWQILLRDRTAIDQARRDLEAGATFEAVAARSLAQAPPPGVMPWDLGYLKWNQVPEPWLPALGQLAVGATSPVIEGPRGRLWIIRVADRRVDATTTFETARPAIELVLRTQAVERAKVELERQLQAGATIELTPAAR